MVPTIKDRLKLSDKIHRTICPAPGPGFVDPYTFGETQNSEETCVSTPPEKKAGGRCLLLWDPLKYTMPCTLPTLVCE